MINTTASCLPAKRQESIQVRRVDNEVKLPRVESWLPHLFAMWPWAKYWTSLCCAQGPLYKMVMLIILSSQSSLKISGLICVKFLAWYLEYSKCFVNISCYYWCGTLQFTSPLTPGPHDTLWARQSSDWHLYFAGRNKGSVEAKSSAQGDTTNKYQK